MASYTIALCKIKGFQYHYLKGTLRKVIRANYYDKVLNDPTFEGRVGVNKQFKN